MGSQESHGVIVRIASGDMSRYANKRDHTDMGLFEVAPDAGLQATGAAVLKQGGHWGPAQIQRVQRFPTLAGWSVGATWLGQ